MNRGLDPPKSDAELLAIALRQGAKVDRYPTEEEIVRRLSEPRPDRRQAPRPRGAVTVGAIERHLEHGRLTGLACTIYGAPRTKKNAVSGSGGFLVTPAYKHWCRGIELGFIATPGVITLPNEPLNLEAHFYVDQKGVPADLAGLIQGLCDALQAAKVVTDDNWIRGFDGSRVHYDQQSHPRTTLELCPLKPRKEIS